MFAFLYVWMFVCCFAETRNAPLGRGLQIVFHLEKFIWFKRTSWEIVTVTGAVMDGRRGRETIA